VTHCSDDDLVLLFYGEAESPAALKAHLAECGECAARNRALVETLQLVAAVDVPERGEHYGLEVWQRIRHGLPEREPFWAKPFRPTEWLRWRAAAVGGGAVLLLAGFIAGRLWPGALIADPQPATNAITTTAPAAGDADASRRVLLLTVADHLERSDRLLTDIVNAAGGGDISAEQQWAEDLLSSSRLYRQDARAADERSIVVVLDELERTLLEIVHRPSRLTSAEIDDLRARIDSAALLFKVRVLGDRLRQFETAERESSSIPTLTSRSS
jgi:hypothetical protein